MDDDDSDDGEGGNYDLLGEEEESEAGSPRQLENEFTATEVSFAMTDVSQHIEANHQPQQQYAMQYYNMDMPQEQAMMIQENSLQSPYSNPQEQQYTTHYDYNMVNPQQQSQQYPTHYDYSMVNPLQQSQQYPTHYDYNMVNPQQQSQLYTTHDDYNMANQQQEYNSSNLQDQQFVAVAAVAAEITVSIASMGDNSSAFAVVSPEVDMQSIASVDVSVVESAANNIKTESASNIKTESANNINTESASNNNNNNNSTATDVGDQQNRLEDKEQISASSSSDLKDKQAQGMSGGDLPPQQQQNKVVRPESRESDFDVDLEQWDPAWKSVVDSDTNLNTNNNRSNVNKGSEAGGSLSLSRPRSSASKGSLFSGISGEDGGKQKGADGSSRKGRSGSISSPRESSNNNWASSLRSSRGTSSPGRQQQRLPPVDGAIEDDSQIEGESMRLYQPIGKVKNRANLPDENTRRFVPPVSIERISLLSNPKGAFIKPLPSSVAQTRVQALSQWKQEQKQWEKKEKQREDALPPWQQLEKVNYTAEQTRMKLRLEALRLDNEAKRPPPPPPSSEKSRRKHRKKKKSSSSRRSNSRSRGGPGAHGVSSGSSGEEDADDSAGDTSGNDSKAQPANMVPRPPAGPSHRSRQLTANRHVKLTELKRATESQANVDPPANNGRSFYEYNVPVKPPVKGGHGYINPDSNSKPLNWSRAFGDLGRRKAHTEAQEAKRPPPPAPGQTEELMTIVGEMVAGICNHFLHDLYESHAAAKSHREELFRDAGESLVPGQFLEYDSDANSEIGGGSPRNRLITETVSKVTKSMSFGRASSSSTASLNGRRSGSGRAGGTTVANDPLPTTTDFVYRDILATHGREQKRRGAREEHKTRSRSGAKSPAAGRKKGGGAGSLTKEDLLDSPSAGNDTENEERGGERGGGGSDESERSFLNVIKLLNCVPNHRPIDELCTIVLWLLAGSSDGTPFDIDSSDRFIDAFSQFAAHAKICLSEVSKAQSEREAGDKLDAKAKLRAAVSLRLWHAVRVRPINPRHITDANLAVRPDGTVRSRVSAASSALQTGAGASSGGSRPSSTASAKRGAGRARSSGGGGGGGGGGGASASGDESSTGGGGGDVSLIAATESVTNQSMDSLMLSTGGNAPPGLRGGAMVPRRPDNNNNHLAHIPRPPVRGNRPVSLGAIRRIGQVQAPQPTTLQQQHASINGLHNANASQSTGGGGGSIADDGGGSIMGGGSSVIGGGGSTSEVLTAAAAPPALAPPMMIKVRIHVALQTFLVTSRLSADLKDSHSSSSPTEQAIAMLANNNKRHERKTGVVQAHPTLVEDTYQDVSRSLVPPVHMDMFQNNNGSSSGSPNRLAQGSAFLRDDPPQMSGPLTTPLKRPRTPMTMMTDGGRSGTNLSVNSSGILGATSSAFPSPGGGGGGGGGGGSMNMDQKERLFHRLAPPLKDSQRYLVAMSLISDVARAIMLNISVLIKHTWAGHEISMSDLLTVFGAPCAKIVNRRLLQELLIWLTANRRSDASFKMSNQTHTDLAMQRLYAFWPSLEVEVLNAENENGQQGGANKNEQDDDDDEDDGGNLRPRSASSNRPRTPVRSTSPGAGAGTGTTALGSMSVERSHSSRGDGEMIQAICCVRLVWPDRHKTNKVFRDPDFYEPNINLI